MKTLKFANSETEFVLNGYVNRGFTQTPNKVNKCLFMSAVAKQVYNCILSYAYQADRCYPSQDTLCAELDLSKPSLIKYLKELVGHGFITTYKNNGRNSEYCINELHKLPVVLHSELIHLIRKANKRLFRGNFSAIVAEYKKSDVYKEVAESDNPAKLFGKINLWFRDNYEDFEDVTMEDEEVAEPVVEILVPEIPLEDAIITKKTATPENTSKGNRKLPPVSPSTQVDVEKEGKRTKKKGKPLNEIPREEWGTNELVRYFEDVHKAETGVVYVPTMADRAMMKKLLDNKASDEIVSDIELFMANDFFNIKHVKTFCSSYVQSVIVSYKRTGKFPDFSKKKEDFNVNSFQTEESDAKFDELCKRAEGESSTESTPKKTMAEIMAERNKQ